MDEEKKSFLGRARDRAVTSKKDAEQSGRLTEMMRKMGEEPVEEKKEEPKIHVVVKGDTLSKIAKAHLGNSRRWPEIFEANKDKIKDPNKIYPGQEFIIPETPEEKK